jgi:hypothetical protein
MTIGNRARGVLLAALATGALLLSGCDNGSHDSYTPSSGGSGYGGGSSSYRGGSSNYSGGGSSGYSGGSRFTAQPPRGPYTPDY